MHHRSPDDWRHAGASAGIVAAMMLGIREVLEPRPSEEIPIVVDHDGEGHDPDPVGVYLHPDIPEATLVVLRPWVTKP